MALGVGHRSTRRVRRERRQRLQRAAAGRLGGQRQHVGLARFKRGHAGLQHLHQPLVEQRDLCGRRTLQGPEGEACRVGRHAQRLQVLRAWPLRPAWCTDWTVVLRLRVT